MEMPPSLVGKAEKNAGYQVFPNTAYLVEDGIEGDRESDEYQGGDEGAEEVVFHLKDGLVRESFEVEYLFPYKGAGLYPVLFLFRLTLL